MPILVVTTMETDDDGAAKLVASHGIDLLTDAHVVLPGEHPAQLGARRDARSGEWIIPDDPPASGS